MKTIDFPSVVQVAKTIEEIKTKLICEDDETLYISLIVYEGGHWALRTGSLQYNSDNRVFYGLISMNYNDSSIDAAEALIEEAKNQAADKGVAARDELISEVYESLLTSLNRCAFKIHHILTAPLGDIDLDNMKDSLKEAVKLLLDCGTKQTWMDKYK